jgi:hypothetical protein
VITLWFTQFTKKIFRTDQIKIIFKSDGAVLKVLENLITFVDEVDDRPVGNPKRRFDEYSSKFSLSYETKVINLVGKSQMTEGNAR